MRSRAGLWMIVVLAAGCASGRQEAPAVATPRPASAPAPVVTPAAPLASEPELEPLDTLTDDTTGEDADPGSALAASLESYETAERFWMEGRFDDAFAELDHAYRLMAEVESDGDALVAQEKEDLRRLISRRIVEIYASQRTVVGDFQGSIPLDVNHHVKSEIASFQGPERQAFRDGYQRSGLYHDMVVDKLRTAGMPEQLVWLPMVESWFKVRALSRARALGMWQFIASTGYRYGLKRTQWADERMDPEKSTDAALAYLAELHDLFGDWLTAVAAYNCGEARIQRLLQQQSAGYFDQFWDLYERLPGETRRYVPRFIAAVVILEDPAKYGFDDLPTPTPVIEVEAIETDRSIRLADLDAELGLAEGSLAALNPELRHNATPDELYTLAVPVDRARVVAAAITDLPAAGPLTAEISIHQVRRGETLSTIAQRYGTSVSTLMRLNDLADPNRISPGQHLRVDGQASPPAAVPSSYTVRRGDSLWNIARRFGTTVDRIQRDNGLRGDTLRPGQRLTLHQGSSSRTYIVRRGDTLGGIASANRISATRLAEANGLSLRSTIYPGERLLIPR
jgi:peptidoglycan lytic transglycosylase D